MSKKQLIIEIKDLLKKLPFTEKKYLLISKNRYSYLEPSRKGPNWIDYIYVYIGVFSLWRPVLKVEWVYSKEKVRKVSSSQLSIIRENEYCFKNKLGSFTKESLVLLKKDLLFIKNEKLENYE